MALLVYDAFVDALLSGRHCVRNPGAWIRSVAGFLVARLSRRDRTRVQVTDLDDLPGRKAQPDAGVPRKHAQGLTTIARLERRLLPSLSPRQRSVYEAWRQGRSNHGIARDLGIGLRDVRRIKVVIARKAREVLGVDSH